MKKEVLFIINPVSGIGKQKIIEKRVGKILNPDKFNIHFTYTQYPQHATTICRDAAKKNIDIVVAVGGDGTINEAANGLVGSETSLAIIPTGSGNGFARFIKIPMNIDKAIKLINTGKPQKIDSIKLNNQYFINVAGVGFDAEISHLFANYGTRGLKSYLKLILKHFISFKAQNYNLLIDGKEINKNAFLISFANSSTWGNNAHIAPLAQINDGILDITILHKFPIIAIPSIAMRLFLKSIHKSKYTHTICANNIIIKNNGELKLHIDGEPITIEGDVNLKVINKSLSVICK